MCRQRPRIDLIASFLGAMTLILLLGTGVPEAMAGPKPRPTPTPTRIGSGIRASVAPLVDPSPSPSASPSPSPTPANSFIGGTVYKDLNDDELHNSDEDGIEDVTVTLQLNNGSGPKRRTETDNDGYYEFRNLPGGTYLVTVEPPDDYETTTSDQLEVKVSGNDGTKLADFGIIGEDQSATATPTATPTAATSTSTSASASQSSNGQTSTQGGSASSAGAAAIPVPNTAQPPVAQQAAAALQLIQSAHFQMHGSSNDNGMMSDFEGEGSVLYSPNSMDLNLVFNGEGSQIIVVGQTAYRRSLSEEFWHPTEMGALRSQHGVLSPLDLVALPKLSNIVRDVRVGGLEELDGGTVRRYQIELGSPLGDPPSRASGQLYVLEGVLDLWVYPFPGPYQGLIYMAHSVLALPSNRIDVPGRVEPAWSETWLRLSDHGSAFTIHAPVNLAPVAAPVPVTASGVGNTGSGAGRPSGGGPVQINPVPSSGGRASEPVGSQPVGTPEAEPFSEPSAAVDRALEALASAAGPRGGSRLELDGLVLAVPWRSQLMDAARTAPTTDGVAALGMILESYGVSVATADLQSLAERWQGKWGTAEPVRLETLIRIGERGSLHPLGPGLGQGGGDWSAGLARDHIRRGYPVLGLFRPSLLTADEGDGDRPDRYMVLMGFEGDYMLYHDPAVPNGAERRVHANELDRAWADASLSRIGVAFGFGTNIVGLLDGSERPVVAAATPLPTTESVPSALTPPEPVPGTGRTTAFGGMGPGLIAFLVALAGGVGFLVARLLR